MTATNKLFNLLKFNSKVFKIRVLFAGERGRRSGRCERGGQHRARLT